MRLIDAKTNGFGRLADAHVNLDQKVIAIVGPNEAGKSTLLRALRFVSESRALSLTERSRTRRPDDDDWVVEVRFAVETPDLDALELDRVEEPPAQLHVRRLAQGGDAVFSTSPAMRKAVTPLKPLVPQVSRALRRKSLAALLADGSHYSQDEDSDGGFSRDLGLLMELVQRAIAGDSALEQSVMVQLAQGLADALAETKAAIQLKRSIQTIAEWGRAEGPQDDVNHILAGRMPQFLFFEEEDRTLKAAYELNPKLPSNGGAALLNLCSMAELSLTDLVRAYREDDVATRDSLLMKANRRLAGKFEHAWNQSDLSVRLSVDTPWLRVSIVEGGENITVFDERSAGLRMFVALVAFLQKQATRVRPVLLIDEAENHLHIDAQADLVDMLVAQERADRIIYTTHSPACLPPDLGTGIRAVRPSASSVSESEIRGSFWTDGAGFSPLMTAMGAAAAAFSTVRTAVLAEGAADMIILPSLLRSAVGVSSLPYRVAPGLAEVPKDFLASLDLEGSCVLYLVDGDEGGRSLRRSLVASGVPVNRVIESPFPGIENAVDPSHYRSVLESLLVEANPGTPLEGLPEMGNVTTAWSATVKTWCGQRTLRYPSKVAVASRLVQEGKAVPSPSAATALADLHTQIVAAFDRR